MTNIERVSSTAAIESLAGYTFSDEDDERNAPAEKRRRTTSRHEDDWSQHERLAPSTSAAPDDDAHFAEPPPPPGHISDEEESPLRHEPPPPQRPADIESPSPSPMLRSNRNSPRRPATEAEDSDMSARSASGAQLPAVARAGGLVSYAHDDDDDDAGSSDDTPSREAEEGPRSRPSSSSGGQAEDPDGLIDDYLEQTLDSEMLEKLRPSDVAPNVKLPPKPQGKCSATLQRKIEEYMRRKRAGQDPNKVIQANKKFRNPSMYEKLVEMLKIDEIGSNFPKSTFNPHAFRPEDLYDELARAQKLAMDKLEKDKASAKPGTDTDKTANAKKQALEEAKKRKSKWDQGGGPSLSNTIGSGARAAVALHSSISAPTSLPAKPR